MGDTGELNQADEKLLSRMQDHTIVGCKKLKVQGDIVGKMVELAPRELQPDDAIDWALQYLEEMKPNDVIECMMMQQLLAINQMSLECSRRSLLSGQTPKDRDIDLQHAIRLMNAFSTMSMALDKRRELKGVLK